MTTLSEVEQNIYAKNLLKKDHMIKDFEVLDNKPVLTSHEHEVLDDIAKLSNSIKDA